jgi:uncharacterized protein (DUF1501 family)
MPEFARMYRDRHAAVIHAVSTPYRDRSHFDGQDVLESGAEKPGTTRTGWLNRLLVGLAPGDRVSPNGGRVFAVGPVTPLVVRGPAPMLSWSPRRILPASDDTVTTARSISPHRRQLRARPRGRMKLAAMAPAGAMEAKPAGQVSGPAAHHPSTACILLRGRWHRRKVSGQPDGPRVGTLTLAVGTHYNGIATGWLAQLLGALDAARRRQDNIGPAWRETVVVLVTEFGRLARINGTDGTDHGTATVMLLAPAALKGT